MAVSLAKASYTYCSKSRRLESACRGMELFLAVQMARSADALQKESGRDDTEVTLKRNPAVDGLRRATQKANEICRER